MNKNANDYTSVFVDNEHEKRYNCFRIDSIQKEVSFMRFGWINAVNAAALVVLIVINLICVRRGIAGAFKSRHTLVNVLEQVGRYGCMALMIVPLTAGWEFGFSSEWRMVAWLLLTVLLLAAYAVLWARKRRGGTAVLYGLALVPVCLFLANGILLQHWLLAAFALLFGAAHLWIVHENTLTHTA